MGCSESSWRRSCYGRRSCLFGKGSWRALNLASFISYQCIPVVIHYHSHSQLSPFIMPERSGLLFVVGVKHGDVCVKPNTLIKILDARADAPGVESNTSCLRSSGNFKLAAGVALSLVSTLSPSLLPPSIPYSSASTHFQNMLMPRQSSYPQQHMMQPSQGQPSVQYDAGYAQMQMPQPSQHLISSLQHCVNSTASCVQTVRVLLLFSATVSRSLTHTFRLWLGFATFR